jgi:hypothetical protein
LTKKKAKATQWLTEEGQATQWPKEEGQATIYKTYP